MQDKMVNGTVYVADKMEVIKRYLPEDVVMERRAIVEPVQGLLAARGERFTPNQQVALQAFPQESYVVIRKAQDGLYWIGTDFDIGEWQPDEYFMDLLYKQGDIVTFEREFGAVSDRPHVPPICPTKGKGGK